MMRFSYLVLASKLLTARGDNYCFQESGCRSDRNPLQPEGSDPPSIRCFLVGIRRLLLLLIMSGVPMSVGWAQGVAVNSVQFSPDGLRIVSAAPDNSIRITDVSTGAALRSFRGHDDYVVYVAWSPDGGKLASASYDGSVRIWDVDSGEVLHELRGHAGTLFYAAFSPDSQTLASAATEGELILWEVATGQRLRTLTAHEEVTASVQFSPDGRYLLSAGRGQLLRLWSADAVMLEAAWTPPGQTFTTGVFSPDGQRIAGGGSSGTLHVFDTSSGDPVAEFATDAFINSLVFAGGGSLLASVHGDGTLRAWDVTDTELVYSVQADPDIAFFVAASPDGALLVTAGQDTRIRLWEAKTGELLRVIE